MKKRNNKLVIIIFVLLIIICASCGTVGLLASKNEGKEKTEEPSDGNYQVVFRYYLDGDSVEEITEQEYLEQENPEFEGAVEKIPLYTFEKYDCTKGITGAWNEEEWKFVTDELTANTTCRLYFTKNVHNMTIKAVNAVLPNNTEEQEYEIQVNKDLTVKIKPNDGYVLDKTTGIQCTSDAKAEYNEETNDLKITNVTKDNTVCTISFKISDLKVEVRVANGNAEESTKSVSYGGSATFNIKPSENYVYESVTCTNGQKATYNIGNQTLTVSGITKDTVCSVQFKPLKYKVTLKVVGGTIAGGSATQEKSEGQNASFGIDPQDGYTSEKESLDCGAGVKSLYEDGAVTVYDVNKDITCTLTLKKSS